MPITIPTVHQPAVQLEAARHAPDSARFPGGSPLNRGPRRPDGTFAPGWRGGGRPRRPDLYAIAQQQADREGIDLAEQLARVVQAMIARALAGDVAAAKLVLDHLTDSDPVKLEVGMDPSQRVAAIKSILQAAAGREDGRA